MPSAFTLQVTDADRVFLMATARSVILDKLEGREQILSEPSAGCSSVVSMELGAFVTLEQGGALRGCIGQVVGKGPLYKAVARMALAAAFDDGRFLPLTREEADDVHISISIMGPIEVCPDPELVEVGRHGLIMQQGARSGLLLPQVAVEWEWDRNTFLAQTCRKAGLPADAWQDAATRILWFEAVVLK
ncbi:AmmeMemoRadiSam system protein A [Oleidesulfovibrio sp.]|uniref:AmmeMemoRadiSam system protein A n=1 Tax=Oleidesulfovibrio sp. TaxID=2909707 RepID=UPI003A897246